MLSSVLFCSSSRISSFLFTVYKTVSVVGDNYLALGEGCEVL